MGVRTVLAGGVCVGLRPALEQAGFVIVSQVQTVEEAVAAAGEHRPDLVLLDVTITGAGVSAVRALTTQVPAAAVVLLADVCEDEVLFGALRAGVRGFLPHDIDPARLASALRGVLAGEAALPRALVARLIEEFRAQDPRRAAVRPGPLAKLTTREWQVLQLLGAGLSTQEIAAEMFVEAVTVRTYIAAIQHKTAVPDRASAVRLLKNS